VTFVFIATFAVGMIVIATKGLDASDRCIDVALFAWIALAAATAAAFVGAVYPEEPTPKARLINALYGAVSVGITVFSSLATIDVVFDRTPTHSMVVRREGVVDARGRHWRVRVDGREWLLAERILGECASRAEVTLELSRGALGQRWIRSVRCPR
jgi:hypothetical protein